MPIQRRLWLGSFYARRQWIWAILLLGVWVRMPGLAAQRSVWMDEILSIQGVRYGVGYLPFLYKNVYGASPLSTLSSWLLFRLSDSALASGDLLWVRLPYLALGMATVWLGWQLGRLWRRWLVGFTLSLLLCLWPFKVYWDVVIRFYAGILFFMMALIVAWEAWRRRPNWPRLTLALFITFWAPLNSMQSFPLLVIPWVYLGWVLMLRGGSGAWRWWRTLPRERFDWKPLAWHAGQAGALAAVTLAVLLCSRGPAWTWDQVRRHHAGAAKAPGILSTTHTKQRLADIISMDSVTGKKSVDLPVLTAGDFIRFAKDGLTGAFRPGHWSPAPLLGLAGEAETFTECFQFYPLRPARAGGVLHALALVTVAIGAVALLRLSPPLLVSLGALILAVGTALAKVRYTQYSSSRYYAIPSLALIILGGIGLSVMLGAAARVLRRVRPPLAQTSALIAALAGGVLLIFAFVGDARRSAGYEAHKFIEFYRAATQRYPQGVLFNSLHDGYLYAFFQDLAIFKHDRLSHDTDYWTSPRRNTFAWNHANGTTVSLEGLALVEKSLDKQAIVVFDTGAAPPDTLREVRPCFDPPQPLRIRPADALCYDLGNKMFVTRGNATIPLLPRFDAPTSASAGRRELSCFYEIPGDYEVRVLEDPANPLLKVQVDGRELLTRQETVAAKERKKPGADWCRRLAFNQYDNVADPRIQKKKCREESPLITTGTATVFQVRTAQAPLAPQRITLFYAHAFGPRRPLMTWRFLPAPASPPWPDVELGNLNLWDHEGGLRVTPTLRATSLKAQGRALRLALVDVAASATLEQTSLSLLQDPAGGRKLEPGDWQFCPPLEINIGLVQKALGRVLCIRLDPGSVGENSLALTYLRFNVVNQRVRIQMERTAEAFR